MPGRSYGPGGKWIHDRAHRIMEEGKTQDQYGSERGKQVAYAIATQQAHKMGTTPKKGGGPKGMYGTKKGKRQALSKFDQPRKDYQKTAEDMTRVNRIYGILKQAGLGSSAAKIIDAVERNPALEGAIIGGIGGAGAGAITAPEGERLQRALKLGLIGTGIGAGTFHAGHRLIKKPVAEVLSPVAAGLGVGAVGKLTGIIPGSEKRASLPGQDLRKQFPGAPRFPTEDSKTRSNELFEQSREVSEVGSVPKPADINKASKGPKIKDITPNMHTTAGDLPTLGKEGSAMQTIHDDPLVQHLMKTAMKAKKQGTSPMDGDAHVPEMDADSTQKFIDTLRELFDHPQGESQE